MESQKAPTTQSHNQWQNEGSEHLRRPEARIAKDLLTIKKQGGLPAKSNGRILCVGCRDAYELYLLDVLYGFHNLVGVDASRTQIALALMLSAYDVRWDDAQILRTVRNGTCDAVLCIHALEHVENRNMALEAFHRVLKPEGTLTVIVPQEQTSSKYHVTNFPNMSSLADTIMIGTPFVKDKMVAAQKFSVAPIPLDDLMVIVRK